MAVKTCLAKPWKQHKQALDRYFSVPCDNVYSVGEPRAQPRISPRKLRATWRLPAQVCWSKRFQVVYQASLVDRSYLVELNETALACMRQRNAKRRCSAFRGHRCDDNGAKVIVHFGRRNDHAGSRLLDLAPQCGIEGDKPNFAADHQSWSASASLPNSPITNASSPCSASRSAASAQPGRADRAGLRSTTASPSTVISASISKPACAKNGFGMTTPCELRLS
jgi:hypothetical protein